MPGESHFARKLGDIAISRAGNGGPNPQDILEALRALNDDTLEREDARSRELAQHIEDDRAALARIASHLESERGHVAEAVAESLRRHCDAVDTPMMLRIEALTAAHADMQAVVNDRGARIEQAKREVVAEILGAQKVRRKEDPEDAEHLVDRAIIVAEKKFTREQAVVAVILFVAAVAASNLIGAAIERALK